jgi:hypothetical protein
MPRGAYGTGKGPLVSNKSVVWRGKDSKYVCYFVRFPLMPVRSHPRYLVSPKDPMIQYTCREIKNISDERHRRLTQERNDVVFGSPAIQHVQLFAAKVRYPSLETLQSFRQVTALHIVG